MRSKVSTRSMLPRRVAGAAGLLALAALLLQAPGAAATADPSHWAVETPEQPAAVLVRGATIWTSGPEGRLENADLLVEDGKITAVGSGLRAPSGALVIDGSGRHVTPGIIDAHSHTAITGGINEATRISTAMVGIEDVLDPSDVNLYRQLAGGVTAANVLHGSANAIGGQNAVIKLRWGASAPDLLLEGAPPGIKFALGENPKQSNWNNDDPRYPQSRIGVAHVLAERFAAARDYRRQLQEARGRTDRVPPRRDLELEALVEILEGERLVHSHSYRADEILMLLRVAEREGFQVASLQHGLEAYKVADEVAAHGAGASIFSDWWAYKYEVIDAIPWAGSILEDRGVVVSFNSDDNELARRLNLEAAKAVRYGGVAPETALAFVTRNPAIQLGIDDRVGSLEPGKDADFVLWSGDPLSVYSRAEQTWIDGRKYFDREEDLARREALAAEREALLARAQGSDEEASTEAAEAGAEGNDPEAGEAPEPEGAPDAALDPDAEPPMDTETDPEADDPPAQEVTP